MKLLFFVGIIICLLGCGSKVDSYQVHDFSKVMIQDLSKDSLSIRAITWDNGVLFYAADKGRHGVIEFDENLDMLQHKRYHIQNNDKKPRFRSIATTKDHYFILSIENPALLYKIDKKSGNKKLVYTESNKKVFYDALAFWNDEEGIAMGDPTDGCLSVIITRDGGDSWTKLPCSQLPPIVSGEAAYAASNSNISIVGEDTWMISGGMKSRVFFSDDKGKSWEVFETPITQGNKTTGAYTMDFYDQSNGIIYGGDYTKPNYNQRNKAVSDDGGNTWKLIADGQSPGYKSSVRYIPNSGGKEIVAAGFTGMSISNDYGLHWKQLTDQGFYTIRFVNDSVAMAAGNHRISKILFKK